MDANSVALLFQEHKDDLNRYAMALTYGEVALAEDVVQRAFLRALEKPDDVDIRYLVRTVRGLVFQTYTERNREREAWDRWNADRAPGEVGYLPVSVQGHKSAGMLGTLTCAQRERVVQLLMRDVSPIAIGKRLGIEDKTRSIYYVRDQMRAVFDREGALRRIGVAREAA